MHTGLFQETLRCALTKPEVAARATELAIRQKQIEDNEMEAKACADAFKQKRKMLELERRSLAREVREESTFRPVECVQRFEKGMILTIRTDTGEQIAERLATETEKQSELFGGQDPDEDGAEEPTE
jgi:electron transfer flavoprotein alpha subunit